ncbi:MAG: M23 family metallopeptidase [Vicinamibacterales bacterium]
MAHRTLAAPGPVDRHRPAGRARWRPRTGGHLLALVMIFAVATQAGAAGAEAPVQVIARALQPGEVVRLVVRCQCGGASPTASFEGGDVPLIAVSMEDGQTVWEGLLGLDLDIEPGDLPVTVYLPGASAPTQLDLRIAPKKFVTRRLTVAPAYVDPPPPVVARILDEADRLDALYATTTERAWPGAVVPPVSASRTGRFGARSVFNGEPRSPHAGVDFRSPAGAPVQAPAPGRVVLAGDLYFTGNTVVIDHGAGVVSVLAHLSTLLVTEGDAVDRGDLVGRVGATGRATGPHLHWSVRLHGARVDPMSLVFAMRPGAVGNQ